MVLQRKVTINQNTEVFHIMFLFKISQYLQVINVIRLALKGIKMTKVELLVFSDNLFVFSHLQTSISYSMTTDLSDFKFLFAYNIFVLYHQQINRGLF